MTVTRTRSGLTLDLAEPRPEDIRIADIAHHLALANRFAGASEFPISVAHHCLSVERILAEAGQAPEICLMGLLHDAHEAWLGDITRPVKQLVAQPRAPLPLAEARLDHLVFRHVGLNPAVLAHGHHIVAAADEVALATEWRFAMAGPCPADARPASFAIRELHWTVAKGRFLDTFRRLAVASGLNPDPDGDAS